MGYDELNVMQKPKDDDDKGGAGSGLGGGGIGDLDDSTSKGKWVKYESDIDNLFDLGRKIADTLQKMMENIDWKSIYAKARNFGKGLADFLNGLSSRKNYRRCFKYSTQFLMEFRFQF